MRCLTWLLAAVALVALCVPAEAISLTQGIKIAKLTDRSSLYRAPSGGSARPGQTQDPLAPTGTFVPVAAGDDNRSVFDVTTIPDSPPFEYVSGSPDQLSGLFYDLTPLNLPAGPGVSTLSFGALGRNPILGTPVGTHPTDLLPIATGGVLEVWLDAGTVSNWDPTATGPAGSGPSAWDEANAAGTAAGMGPNGHAGAPDTFPTVNDSGEVLWLQIALLPFPGAGVDPAIPRGTLLQETVDLLGSEAGSGKAFGTVVGGSFLPNIVMGGLQSDYAADWDRVDDGLVNGTLAPPAGLTAEFEILFDVDPDPALGTDGYGVRSQDPTVFRVIPEPVTMTGMILGFGSLVGYVRKRRK